VTVDKSGKHWRGTEAGDLDELLDAYSAREHPVGRTVHSRCANCGSAAFGLRVDDEQGYADRRCLSCGTVSLMLDSEDTADEAAPEDCACPCGGEAFELAAGYALRDDGDVRWVYVGARCLADGTLGVYTDWKIDYGPTDQLFERA
jgi:hypothetical protein